MLVSIPSGLNFTPRNPSLIHIANTRFDIVIGVARCRKAAAHKLTQDPPPAERRRAQRRPAAVTAILSKQLHCQLRTVDTVLRLPLHNG
jgi:hypothetical protein